LVDVSTSAGVIISLQGGCHRPSKMEGDNEMFDSPLPDVVTKVRIGKLRIYIYAYRKLSESECKAAIKAYMLQQKLKQLPKSGSLKIVSILGFDQ